MHALLSACTSLLLAFFALPANAEVPPVQRTLPQIVEKLDLKSFPNSVGPRRHSNKTTFADYGFSEVTHLAQKTIVSDAEHGWEFVITLLDGGLICLEDRARNGGSYHTQNAYALTPEPSGFLQAQPAHHDACPSYAK